jgi:hypothetical protein
MPRNDPIGRAETGTKPVSVNTLKHQELQPLIGHLQSQLRVLELQRAAILKRIGTVKKIVAGLAALYGSDVINRELQDLLSLHPAGRLRAHPGLTVLCRQLMREASGPLTVPQMLRQLQEKFPDGLARQRNAANSLRVILRRLVAYGEAEELLTDEGLHAWRATATSKRTGQEES